MAQINLLQTNSPQTPSTGRAGIFINSSNVPFIIDDAGNQIPFSGAGAYPEALARENNTVLFDNDYVTGIIAAARTGNILFDFTGAKLGATTYMRHQDASAFTFPAQAILLFDSADVSTTDANFFCFLLVDKTGAGEEVHVTLAQEGV